MAAPRDIRFRAAPNYPTGTMPSSIAVADLNRDGLADIATLSEETGTITILLNQNGTSFVASRTLSVPAASALIAADLDFDGLADLATANGKAGSVSVLLNRGGAQFVSGTFFVGGTPSALALYGSQLAVADRTGDRVVLLQGDGLGRFVAVDEITVGNQPISLGVGDFDGDRLADLASANVGSRDFTLMLATDGGFETSNFRLDQIPGKMAVGDVDLDGFADIALTYPVVDRVAVFQSRRGRGFEQPIELAVPAIPSAIVIADDDTVRVTGDGRPDIAVLSQGTSTLSIYRGFPNRQDNRLASFELTARFVTSRISLDMGVGEMDGDMENFADWAVANNGNDSVTFLAGRESAALVAAISFDTGAFPSAMLSGDFDSDGNVDLLTADSASNTLSLLAGNGRGSLRDRVLTSVDDLPDLLAKGDFTEDGIPDAVVGSSFTGQVRLYQNQGGVFRAGRSIALPAEPLGLAASPVAMAAGDINGNLAADLVVADEANSAVHVVFDPNRSDQLPATLAAPNIPSDVVIADMNRDNLADVLVAAPDGDEVVIWFQLLSASFSTAQSFAGGSRPTRLVTTDLNRDGRTDVITLSPETGTIQVLPGQDSGLGSPTSIVVGGRPAALVVADFNFDQLPDLAVVDSQNDIVLAFAGDGTGRLVQRDTITAGLAPSAILADFYRGAVVPDLIVLSPAANQVVMLRNTSNTGTGPEATPTATPATGGGGGSGCNLGETGSSWLLGLVLLGGAIVLTLASTYGRRA